MTEPTNTDILDRLSRMEQRFNKQDSKLDNIERIVQRATGMWILSKWVAGGLLALATVWGSVHNWWQR